MKRVLLTGGGGFLGSHVLRCILEQTDWHVDVVDSFNPATKGDRRRLPVDGRGIPKLNGRWDVMTWNLTKPLYRPVSYDCIINVASGSHIPRSIADPRPFIENNVALMLSILEHARAMKPVKILHVSTSEVYGPTPGTYDFQPGDRHYPTNPYAASKAAQEDIAIAYRETYGLSITLVGTMNIIGEMQDREKFVPTVIRKIRDGETVQIHTGPGGPVSRYYIHAACIADALLWLIDKPNDPSHFHVVGEREVSALELATGIAECMGRELHVELVAPDRPGHDQRYGIDGTDIRQRGWRAPLTFEQGLKQTVQWYLDNQDWL
jgi:dTDP-glucose 4,6-dehydratase